MVQVLLLGHPRRLIRDTAFYPPLMRKVGPTGRLKPQALRNLAASQLGLAIQAGEHSPVDDARATLYLYHRHRKVDACKEAACKPDFDGALVSLNAAHWPTSCDAPNQGVAHREGLFMSLVHSN